MRILLVAAGIANLVLAVGYSFQMPWTVNTWPWPDGRLSYLFVGSILAAIAAVTLWIGVSGEWEPLAAGALNLIVMMGGPRRVLLPFGRASRPAPASGVRRRRWPICPVQPGALLVGASPARPQSHTDAQAGICFLRPVCGHPGPHRRGVDLEDAEHHALAAQAGDIGCVWLDLPGRRFLFSVWVVAPVLVVCPRPVVEFSGV